MNVEARARVAMETGACVTRRSASRLDGKKREAEGSARRDETAGDKAQWSVGSSSAVDEVVAEGCESEGVSGRATCGCCAGDEILVVVCRRREGEERKRLLTAVSAPVPSWIHS